jgi:hypothetical protein
MNARVLQARPARAVAAPGPGALKPSRSFAGPDAAPPAGADTARQGHDFARVAVGPAADAAPIQRVKVHHDPAKKKYLAKGVGAKQNAVSKAQRAIINQGGATRKEAKRIAKAQVRRRG